MSNNNYQMIPKEKFQLVQRDERIHDSKLDTKARSYMADAFLRFRKNKSSVIAAVILIILVLYAIIAPILSPYDENDSDGIYANKPAYVPGSSWLNGGKTIEVSDAAYNDLRAIAQETGYNPIIKVIDQYTRVNEKDNTVSNIYKVEVNQYFSVGMRQITMTYEEFQALQDWQDEHEIQVIYPWVEPSNIKHLTFKDNPAKYWYQVDKDGNAAIKNEDGTYTLLGVDDEFVCLYSTNSKKEGAPYTSKMRVEGDDGSYIYSGRATGSVKVRVCYYNYYQYLNGREPSFVLGTDAGGRDLLWAIGAGARFSIIFAILVSAINLSIGAIYGSIQGYYGGMTDLIMDRVTDVLSGVPFIVVTTLFQLHLAEKVGTLPSFLFAFVLTGWIGMAGLTRKQFYRFKSQEFVMAARTLGASDKRLMFKHIFPNAIGTMITSCALVIPGVIGSETSMTYLGIVDLESYAGTTLGTLLARGQSSMVAAPHAMLWPSVYLALLMICFNLFGNGLRDAFNPSTRGAED